MFAPPRFESADADAARSTVRRKGTELHFRSDDEGTASVHVEKMSPGIEVGGACVRRTRARLRTTRRPRACTYPTVIGTLRYAMNHGVTVFAWRGSHPETGRALPPGLYRATLWAFDGAGQGSAPLVAVFRILRPRPGG